MRDAMHGRWLVDDTDARDAVLAAIQLQAATDAQGELRSDWKTVRDRVTKADEHAGGRASGAACSAATT